MYLALLLALRVARAIDGPEGGTAKRCRISFGLRDLRGICIPFTSKVSQPFFLGIFLKLFIFLCEVFCASTFALIMLIPCFAIMAMRAHVA